MNEVASWILHPYETTMGVLSELPPALVGKVGGLISILQAIGIALLAYIIFLFVKGILTFKRLKRLSKIEERLTGIDKKIDLLLKEETGKKENKNSKKKK